METWSLLRDKLGQEVDLVIESSIRDKTLGNMNPMEKPRVSTDVIQIELLGVYGLPNEPAMYILGRFLKTNRVSLFCNNVYMSSDEETQEVLSEYRDRILSLAGENVANLFDNYRGDSLALEHLVSEHEPEIAISPLAVKDVVKGLMSGKPNYHSGQYNLALSMITDSQFIHRVKTYFTKFV